MNMKHLIKHIIQQLEDVQDGKLWIGSSFESKLKDLDKAALFIRPLENLPSVA